MSFAYLALYTGDYLRDTRHLTPLRHGVYFLALMYCWDSRGPMPLDEQEASGICNCRSADEVEALRYVLGKFFVRMPDGHYNKRMAEEIERACILSDKRAGAARDRWNARAAIIAMNSHASALQVHSKTTASAPPLPPSPSLPSTQYMGETPKPPAPAALSGKPARKRTAKPAPSAETWSAYAAAYAGRYGAEPVRNAGVNAKLALLVGKLGEAEAPAVAAFFVSHQGAFYVRGGHAVDLLLRDAEKLRTEWFTGRTVTNAQAIQADKTQTNINVFAPMIAKAMKEEANAKR